MFRCYVLSASLFRSFMLQIHDKICQKRVLVLLTYVRITSLFILSRHKYATNTPLFCSYMLESRSKYAALRPFTSNFVKNTPQLPRRSPVNNVRSRASTRSSRPFYVAVCHQRPKERSNERFTYVRRRFTVTYVRITPLFTILRHKYVSNIPKHTSVLLIYTQ